MGPTAFSPIQRVASILSLSVLASAILFNPAVANAQTPGSGASSQAKPAAKPATDPNDLRPLNQDSSVLSLQGGQRLMQEAGSAAAAQRYSVAIDKLQEARQVFNQLTNFYQELAGSFSGIDNRIATAQRRKAGEAAQLRDEATYELAIVHRANNQPDLAVPLLIQIIRSQQPTRELGKKASQQLFELGFQDASLLSIPGGKRVLEDANAAISAQNYDLALKKLQEARQIFNQLSNFHQELASSFTGIDNALADDQRSKALESAQLRDQATYRLALVHRAKNQPELAVPLLIQIVRSQQPTRELGKQAYQQLFELGFVDSPYPRNANQSSSR